MQTQSMPGRRLWLAILAAALVLLPSPAATQAQNASPTSAPTAEQLDLLRTLSPEDRDALMRQLGIGDSSLGNSTNSSSAGAGANGVKPPSSSNQPNRLADSPDELDRYDKRLKPEESVLIDIDFVQPKPSRVETIPGQPSVTIPGEPAPPLEPEERKPLERLVDLIRSKNPYQLDRTGALQLPGYAPIALAGLDEMQATRRLAAEPSLLKLQVKLTRLPLTKVGSASLKPFGYDLFKQSANSFQPITDAPVPTDYVVGPGDQLSVQLYGSQNRTLRLVVSRDGRINFPEIGPINVVGQTFNRVASNIEARVARQMIGVRASVSMGDARGIRVFVLGEASKPGSYSVSGLGTVTTALFAAGGVRAIGSLRDIQLKRQGAVVRRLDLYDLLMRGDTSNDAKLLPGDVVFVPPVGATVTIDGEVRRPAIYELKGDTDVAEILQLAGGLTADADNSRIALVRIDEKRRRIVVNVPLVSAEGRKTNLRYGDSLRVLRLRPTLDSGISVEGHVFRPGAVAWREGLRISDVLPSVEELKPNADLGYILIRRELPPDRRIAIVSADLSAALRAPGSRADVVMSPHDRVIVFDAESSRRAVIDPLLEELKRQARLDQPSELVRIDGQVKAPGEYPLEAGMRVSDLLRAGGSLQDSAYGAKAELTRYKVVGDVRQTELLGIDLAAVRRGDANADVALQPFDFLTIQETPEWRELEQVTLKGEVRFPGTYPIRRGETLRSVLDRAGGLTPLAFAAGSVFTRKELREREKEQLERLSDRLQTDLATSALQASQAKDNQAGQALTIGQSLLAQIKTTKPVGRLVIDLDRALALHPGSSADVALRNGDELAVPKIRQEVTVLGEVQNSTSHLFTSRLSRDDYISLSGGTTRKADRKHIYVVRADGSVVGNVNSGWFRRSAQVTIKPGDTIVVPLDTERLPTLPLWQAVTQIMYNIAIAASAVKNL